VIRRTVVVSRRAQLDLIELYDHIADAASSQVAEGYLERLNAWLAHFDLASERGSRRDDLRSGMRMVGFERRATIAFLVQDRQVTILRIFPGGRDWPSTFEGA
jgi:toxin ParE1/3/4